MVSVYRCEFTKLYQGIKKDNTKYFILTVTEETEKSFVNHNFFVNNEIALNLNNCSRGQKIAISFDIFFDSKNQMIYRIKQIVVEK